MLEKRSIHFALYLHNDSNDGSFTRISATFRNCYEKIEIDIACNVSKYTPRKLYKMLSHPNQIPMHDQIDIKTQAVVYLVFNKHRDDAGYQANGLKSLLSVTI